MGLVIGSGIFLVPSSIAQSLPSAAPILAVWIGAGVLTFFGALGFAELGAMLPATGGQYVYLREAYGPFPAFLYGWALFWVIWSGGIAAMAVGFAMYLSYFVPLTGALIKLAAVGLIAALTWVNYRGVRPGSSVQNAFAAMKVAGLAVLIASAFLYRQAPGMPRAEAVTEMPWSNLGAAMIACLFTYEGWSAVNFVAGEVRAPQRNLPLALALGIAFTIAVYVMANVAYLRVLSIQEIAAAPLAASAMAQRSVGSLGASLVSLIILLSIVGSTNGAIMTGPRVFFAQARDRLFLGPFGQVHPKFQTPWVSIIGQGAWAAVLALTGSFHELLSYATFASWVFYVLAVAGVLMLRRKRAELNRPYKMWGYPMTPLLFSAAALGVLLSTAVATPRPAALAILLIATGIPFYFLWQRKRKT